MALDQAQFLDERLRLRLADLEPQLFEEFFLRFLTACGGLTINRHGKAITKRPLSVELYATGAGRDQKGIDLRAVVEDGEVWAFQCKRCKKWTVSDTREAIQKAAAYQADHYFLVVACDPHERVQDEMESRPNWTFWNLSTICAQFAIQVPPIKRASVLFFFRPEELRKFIPHTTGSFIEPNECFGKGTPLPHDLRLVGRDKALLALDEFARGPRRIHILSAEGGQGKSRLLWALCQKIHSERPDAEILCLNPNRARGDEDFAFAFQSKRSSRLIIIDDAHRQEQLPALLFRVLASVLDESPETKVLFAARPQGVEPLRMRLREHRMQGGCSELGQDHLALPRLKKARIRELAEEVLGGKFAAYASDLAALTADSPFLTVLAGNMLRSGGSTPESLLGSEDLRHQVLHAFEEKCLSSLPDPGNATSCKRLLRLVALLAPVQPDLAWIDLAADCLASTPLEVDEDLGLLRRLGLVAGANDRLRVVPDLFADFLAYDACYAPDTNSKVLVARIIDRFRGNATFLFKNLAEATWVARKQGPVINELRDPLVTLLECVKEDFRHSTSFERYQTLARWSEFSIYLPAEALEIATLAAEAEKAPLSPSGSDWNRGSPREWDTPERVLYQLPTLLKPIVVHHPEHRRSALSLLWRISEKPLSHRGRDAPLEVIADCLSIKPARRPQTVIETLDWLQEEMQTVSRAGQAPLQTATSALPLLLKGCFTRLMEWTTWETSTCTFVKKAIPFKDTQPIRARAFAILEWVIEHGSRGSALHALSALEPAMRCVTMADFPEETEPPGLVAMWSPVRLKALTVCEKLAAKHQGSAFRFKLLSALKTSLAGDTDLPYRQAAEALVASLPLDLSLRTTMALGSQSHFDVLGTGGTNSAEKRYAELETIRLASLRELAGALALQFPIASDLGVFLSIRVQELITADCHVRVDPLFAALVTTAPKLAADLVSVLVTSTAHPTLAMAWPVLLESNPSSFEAQRVRVRLLESALQGSPGPTRSGAVLALSRLVGQVGNDARWAANLLADSAPNATEDETRFLLQMMAWAGGTCLPTLSGILDRLPLSRHAPKVVAPLLDALAPYGDAAPSFAEPVVRRVLMNLRQVPDPEFDSEHLIRTWAMLADRHPRILFDFFLERIEYASQPNVPADYRAVPVRLRASLKLSGASATPDLTAILTNLWERILDPHPTRRDDWVRLFQLVAWENPTLSISRLKEEIDRTHAPNSLLALTDLLRFDGSLVIFGSPELTRSFLLRAAQLDGPALEREMRLRLHAGCGPRSRGYTDGVLDEKYDYVEAAAIKAAEEFAADTVLGPFYRWLVMEEQRTRRLRKSAHDQAAGALD